MTAALLVEDDLAAAAPGARHSARRHAGRHGGGDDDARGLGPHGLLRALLELLTATFTPSGKRRKASSRFWASSVNCTGIGPTWVIATSRRCRRGAREVRRAVGRHRRQPPDGGGGEVGEGLLAVQVVEVDPQIQDVARIVAGHVEIFLRRETLASDNTRGHAGSKGDPGPCPLGDELQRDPLRRERQMGQPHARRVLEGVGDRGRRRDDRRLADAARAERARPAPAPRR